MVLCEIIEAAKRAGIRTLTGVYRPTDRNKLVEDHYAKLGFTLIDRSADGTTTWELDVHKAGIRTVPMVVHSLGLASLEA